MKIIRNLFLSVLFVSFYFNVYSQSGCYTAGGNKDLYTMTGTATTTTICGAGTQSYSNTQTKYNKPAGCNWVPLSTSGTCKVNTPEGNNLCGIIGIYTLACPIDDYTPLALCALAGIGSFFLTRFNF